MSEAFLSEPFRPDQAHPTQAHPDHIHELIGIGFGPSNLALAIALEERQSGLDAVFLEAKPRFAWHPGMLLKGTDMQVSFLKDLVSQRNPTSGFSFLSYLHDKGRLERFINRKTFFPSRVEFNDYLDWAAGRLGGICAYDQRVEAIEPVRAGAGVSHLRIHSRDGAGRATVRQARQIVLAPGGQPHWPELFAPHRSDARLSHSNDFTARVLPKLTPGERIAVIGGGQSACEIFATLAADPACPRVDLILRGPALKPADDSPFVNEIFEPAHTDLVHALPPEARAQHLREFAGTNYAVTDLDLLQHIYGLLYEQEVEGAARLRMMAETQPVGLQTVGQGAGLHLTLDAQGRRFGLDYDRIILCTGYRRELGQTLLSGLADWQTGAAPDRDYRLPMKPGFAPTVHVQGYSEPTHGLADTLLSVLALRSAEIAASVELARADRRIAAE
ncbi:lysine N(6)-hydroxylase/L-ornithine N(5)-oxygenase family protein [Paracoccus aminophilus]|uniref:L-ornithine N5-oxygenase n=1 Tax=Paracoccus aminophilus JCM 7686 TaxID=1367847 RepID=S5XTC8_PARAH|nr:lysine N(6)-hydroxylase/L-ornithine N(5)-oxygenase family protein [Paracoccus aminophilus]AGT10749.1 L-ornithine N5-oxygenase [Paracoccus aminophilus JCM 7686]